MAKTAEARPERSTTRLHRSFEKIDSIASLRRHLQIAIELEAATIPPYLCALYSIPDGQNRHASGIIRSVVVEEMLHIALAANVLNAIDGHPQLNHAYMAPRYPVTLPHSEGDFEVGLRPFGKEAIKTFLKIERPGKPKAHPQADHYHSIGQFYVAIEEGLKTHAASPRAYTGKREYQVTSEYYYGSGRLVEVWNLETALKALARIVDEGEGLDHTLFTTKKKFPAKWRDENLAHYFRFKEVFYEHSYDPERDNTHDPPSGPRLKVDWEAVYPMRVNPRMEDYPVGSEIWNLSMDFSRTYMRLLNILDKGFNGHRETLVESVNVMYELKYRALALMRIPFGEGTTAGPTFEYLPPASQ